MENYFYYKCHNCTALFFHPRPPLQILTKYYRSDFEYTAGEANEEQNRLRAGKILAKLKEFNSRGRKLLDIGSGFGYFLDEANNLNFRVSGVEPAKKIYKTAINLRLKTKVKNLSFEKYYERYKSQTFDFITLTHLIEHIPYPHDFITKVLDLLNPGGILYIETPNLNSRLFKAEKTNYTFLTPPDHIWLFSLASLKFLFKKIKRVEILRASSYSQPEHLMGILKTKLKNTGHGSKNNSNRPSTPSLPMSGYRRGFQNVKYLFFDKLLAPLFTPWLNIGGYGSILELYIRKS